MGPRRFRSRFPPGQLECHRQVERMLILICHAIDNLVRGKQFNVKSAIIKFWRKSTDLQVSDFLYMGTDVALTKRRAKEYDET